MAYAIQYSDEARTHLRSMTARQRSIVIDAVDGHLTHQPYLQTRNRKPMEENPFGPWVLRVGDVRVYYEVEDEPAAVVRILSVGVKDRNVFRAGGQEYDLTRKSTDEGH